MTGAEAIESFPAAIRNQAWRVWKKCRGLRKLSASLDFEDVLQQAYQILLAQGDFDPGLMNHIIRFRLLDWLRSLYGRNYNEVEVNFCALFPGPYGLNDSTFLDEEAADLRLRIDRGPGLSEVQRFVLRGTLQDCSLESMAPQLVVTAARVCQIKKAAQAKLQEIMA